MAVAKMQHAASGAQWPGPTSLRPYSVLMLVTPEWAVEMLQNVPVSGNRSMTEYNLHRISRAIADGRWMVTGEPIIIGADGTLLDGQHRLAAVAATGIPIWTFVTFNITPEAWQAMNSGKSRSTSDRLSAQKHKNSRDMAALLKWVYRYSTVPETGKLMTYGEAAECYFMELHDLLNNNPELVDSLGFVGWDKDSGVFLNRPIMAFVHFMGAKTSREKADEFVTRVKDGANLRDSDPAYVLRRVLISNASHRLKKLDRDYLAAITTKAWIAYEEGRSCKQLKWLSGESFPRFRCSWPAA